MTVKKSLIVTLALIASFIFITASASARDWDDLHEENEKAFGSEKEMKYNPDMFFLQRESWEDHYSFMLFWLFKYTDYPKYSSLKLLPFYYGLDSKIDNRSQSFIPFMLTYRERDGNEKFKVNPLFISGNSRTESGYEDDYSVSWLHGYFYTKNPAKERPDRTWWVPVIPLVYRSTDNYGGHMNIGWLLDYSWDREKSGAESLSRFWLMPLAFHKAGDDGYTHLLPPVFLYNRHNNGEYWLSLFPLFKRSKDITYNYYGDEKSKYEYEDSFKSLIFCYNSTYKDKWRGEKKSSEFWFPFIPLVYSYHEDGVESHRNILWLIDWHNDASGSTDRFWFVPFYFAGDNSYRHILPPLYMSFYDSENNNYSHLFPVYLSSRSESSEYDAKSGKFIPAQERLFLTPLSGYSSTTAKAAADNINSISYWFPLLPIYYHSEDAGGSHTNLLWAFDWGRDSSGNIKRIFIMPFIFHESGEGGYRFYFPFFFRPQGWSETGGVTYSPLYYHMWSSEEDTKWSWLIHYKSRNNKTGDYMNTWMPFYYHHNDPGTGETTWLMPVYYHHDGLEHGGYFARIYAPLYWNIDTGKRDSTLFLPLYFETAKKNRTGSTYINILGYSRSMISGVNPVIDASLGSNRKGVYVDIDASWLIDMVSVSTRMTLPMKSGEEEIFREEDAPTGEITLSKKNSVSRDSSLNFWGFHALYGLIAFEKADTKRHLRILPLSWLTWDSESDDRIKVILNYVSYKEDETEYLVFFPFYGYQRVGESYSTGYMLNGFWHEYDHEKQMNEYTVLWPFINWYSSPEKNGWRVLPLVWHKNRTEENVLHSSTYTPLYMNISERSTDDDSPLYRLNLSPLHFYRYNREKDKSSTLWFSSIPFIFYKNNETVSQFELPGTVTEKTNSKKQKNEPKVTSDYITTGTIHWLFPIYFKSETGTNDTGKGITTSGYTLIGLPLLYYHSETEKSSAAGAEEKKNGKIFLMGYYSEFSSESDSSSILFGLYESERHPATEDYSYSLFYGLFNISDMDGKYENYFRPLYYYGNDHGKKEHSALIGIYNIKRDSNNNDSDTSLLYNLFDTSLRHYTIDPMKRMIPVAERETWLVPLFYYSNINSSDTGKPYNENLSFSPVHYRHTLDNNKTNEYEFWVPIIPLLYRSSDAGSTHTNFCWLLDFERGYAEPYTRFWLIPFLFSKSGDTGYFHIAPLFFSWWDKKSDDNTYFIAGLYLHNMPGYSRQNFLYLYDHKSYAESNRNNYSLLFGTMKYEVDPEIKRIRAFWGLLADAEWNKNGYDIESLLYLAAIERDGSYFHTRFIPLWYYESTENSHTMVIPPALTWDSEDSDNSRLQLWALGALWFRNYEPAEHSDLQAALLGIPYYKIERAERGYESRGSLWGLLWEYETESETGFSKFSLLKFLYKRVDMDGEVQHKVFGITF